MSQDPYPASQPFGMQPPAPSNGLGIAGFVVSLVGLLLTCGLISPIGLILSFIAVFKQPRGFAIAGVVIGILGSLLLAVCCVWFFTVGMGQFGGVEGLMAIGTATQKINAYAQKHHELPDDEEGQDLIDGIPDGNGTELRYRRLGENKYELRSAGPDGEFDTADDFAAPVVSHH